MKTKKRTIICGTCGDNLQTKVEFTEHTEKTKVSEAAKAKKEKRENRYPKGHTTFMYGSYTAQERVGA